MMVPMAGRISSPGNPRIKQLVRLQRRSSARRESGLFCVESQRELWRALDAGFELVEAFVCAELFTGSVDAPQVTHVSETVLRKVAYRQNPEGLVAIFRSRGLGLQDLAWNGSKLLVVCSGVEKPGNVGAILRSADAAGVAAVLIDSPDADIYNPNCIRASTGAVFSVPVVCASREAIRQTLSSQGVTIAAAAPEGAITYTDADLSGSIALVFGAEAAGLDPFWRVASDLAVRIPQRGTVDSLNVSVTAALMMFEAVRQREQKAARPEA
jgi:RNA methyltransferase, TrmH family